MVVEGTVRTEGTVRHEKRSVRPQLLLGRRIREVGEPGADPDVVDAPAHAGSVGTAPRAEVLRIGRLPTRLPEHEARQPLRDGAVRDVERGVGAHGRDDRGLRIPRE